MRPNIASGLLVEALLLLATSMATGQVENPRYDADLAEKLGADDYGMKSYIFVLLKTGDNRSTDRKLIDSCFTGHLDNIGRLVEMNKMIAGVGSPSRIPGSR